jgi:DNA ligase (NAD+)
MTRADETRESDMRAVDAMADRLERAARLYYQDDADSDLTDEEYDAGVAYLRTMIARYHLHDDRLTALTKGLAAGTSPGANANAGGVVIHDTPMLSLEKADSREDVIAYLDRLRAAGATGFRLQAKFDGIACSAVYHDGRLADMSSRGDGRTGEDMAYLIGNGNVTIDGLPARLAGPLAGADVEIRGELFLRPSEFARLNARRSAAGLPAFANPRNTNAGIVKRAATGGDGGERSRLQFVMYRIVGDARERDLIATGVAEATAVTMEEWGRSGAVIPGGSLTVRDGDGADDRVMAIVDAFDPVRARTDLSLDGIVIKPLNEHDMDVALGATDHHPRSQIAYKYPGAKAQVRITGVDWTIGKSGKLTPRLNYERTWIGGSWNEHATLHNTAILAGLGLKVGSVVEIEKRHDVIPEVVTAVGALYTPDDGVVIAAPARCPACGTAIDVGDRVSYCPNAACPGRGANMARAAVGRTLLDIDGMGESLVDALYERGVVVTIADLYDLDETSLAGTVIGSTSTGGERTVGGKRARHIMESLAASRNVPYPRVLASLAIPGLGRRLAARLITRYPDIDALHGADVDDLAGIDGVGPVRARVIVDGIADRWPVIERLRAAGLRFHADTAAAAATADPAAGFISGHRFSISGAVPTGWENRADWQAFIESMGGIAQSSPTRDTDYMVGDANGSSSKIRKALAYGVRIITPDEFTRAAGR